MTTTHQVEAVYHDQRKTIFHIPSKHKVLTFLRLVDLKVTKSDDSVLGDAVFNLNAGLFSVIKTITLFSDTVVLDQLKNVANYMGFKNLNRTVVSSVDIARFVNGLSINSSVFDTNQFSFESLEKADDVQGRILLSQVLPYLKNRMIVDKQNLRLVVEWNTDVTECFIEANRPANMKIVKPFLLVDEVYDETLKKHKHDDEVYRAIEYERVSVPLTAAVADVFPQQQTVTKLRGFHNKLVRRMLVMTDNTNSPNSDLGRNRSHMMNAEKIQIYVNNVKKYQYNGVDSPNRKLAMLTDAFGKLSLLQGCQLAHLNENSQWNTNPNAVLYNLAYFGTDVDDVVNDFQLNYIRTGKAGVDALNSALQLHVYCEVEKFVKNTQKGVMTGYAL